MKLHAVVVNRFLILSHFTDFVNGFQPTSTLTLGLMCSVTAVMRLLQDMKHALPKLYTNE